MTARLPSVPGFPSRHPRLLAGTPNSDPTVRWKRTAWVDSKAPSRCGDGSANSACVLGPVSRLGILEEETHYRADRSTHLFRTLRSSACRGPAGVGAMILGKMATPVTGQMFPEPSPTLPAMPGRWPVGAMCQPLLPHPPTLLPSWWLGAIWGNRRWSEEGSQSAFLSLSSAPVGFLQFTSSPLNDTLSAYLIMLYQYVHFFHMTIFSGETFGCYLSLDLNILTFVKWLKKTIFISILLFNNI